MDASGSARLSLNNTTRETIVPSPPYAPHVVTLSNNDQIMPPLYTSFVYFFPAPANSQDPILPSAELKRSLARALAAFPPVAGRLVPRTPAESGFDVHCDNQGAVFVDAHSPATLQHLLTTGTLKISHSLDLSNSHSLNLSIFRSLRSISQSLNLCISIIRLCDDFPDMWPDMWPGILTQVMAMCKGVRCTSRVRCGNHLCRTTKNRHKARSLCSSSRSHSLLVFLISPCPAFECIGFLCWWWFV